jgi:hypothetical protein
MCILTISGGRILVGALAARPIVKDTQSTRKTLVAVVGMKMAIGGVVRGVALKVLNACRLPTKIVRVIRC